MAEDSSIFLQHSSIIQHSSNFIPGLYATLLPPYRLPPLPPPPPEPHTTSSESPKARGRNTTAPSQACLIPAPPTPSQIHHLPTSIPLSPQPVLLSIELVSTGSTSEMARAFPPALLTHELFQNIIYTSKFLEQSILDCCNSCLFLA